MNTFMDFQEDSSCVFLACESAVASNVLVDETGSYIWAGSDTNVLIVNVIHSDSSSFAAKKRNIAESFERISSP